MSLLERFLIFLFFSSLFVAIRGQVGGLPNSINPADPVVNTRYGLVRGSTYRVTSQNQPGRTFQFLQFIGVPYAAPPTGSNRFRVSFSSFFLDFQSFLNLNLFHQACNIPKLLEQRAGLYRNAKSSLPSN